jgi:hypothetical protein
VVGVPDPDLGEIVVAFLVGKDLDLMSIKDHLGKTWPGSNTPKNMLSWKRSLATRWGRS